MMVPRPDYVIISPIGDPDKSPGGIIIPNEAKERVDQGIVKYTGANCKWLQPGDYVLFNGYAGETITIEDGNDSYLIAMQEKLVNAIIGDQEWLSCSVMGLYHRDKDGNYFHATVESAIRLIRHAAANAGFVRPVLRYRKIDYSLDPKYIRESEELWDEVPNFNKEDSEQRESNS